MERERESLERTNLLEQNYSIQNSIKITTGKNKAQRLDYLFI